MNEHEPEQNMADYRIPVIEEMVRYEKRQRETGRVTVRSRVQYEQAPAHASLTTTHVRIERVPCGQFVDEVPSIRTEGDRTIVPVVEEVLVKRLRLVEEVHLVMEEQVTEIDDTATLRRLEVSVERSGAPSPDYGPDGVDPEDGASAQPST